MPLAVGLPEPALAGLFVVGEDLLGAHLLAPQFVLRGQRGAVEPDLPPRRDDGDEYAQHDREPDPRRARNEPEADPQRAQPGDQRRQPRGLRNRHHCAHRHHRGNRDHRREAEIVMHPQRQRGAIKRHRQCDGRGHHRIARGHRTARLALKPDEQRRPQHQCRGQSQQRHHLLRRPDQPGEHRAEGGHRHRRGDHWPTARNQVVAGEMPMWLRPAAWPGEGRGCHGSVLARSNVHIMRRARAIGLGWLWRGRRFGLREGRDVGGCQGVPALCIPPGRDHAPASSRHLSRGPSICVTRHALQSLTTICETVKCAAEFRPVWHFPVAIAVTPPIARFWGCTALGLRELCAGKDFGGVR